MHKVTRRWGFHALQRLVIHSVYDEKDDPQRCGLEAIGPMSFMPRNRGDTAASDGVPMRRSRDIKKGPAAGGAPPSGSPRGTPPIRQTH